MNHHVFHSYSDLSLGSALVGLAAIVVIVFVFLLMLRHRLVGPSGLSRGERKSLDAGEAEVLAMLRQTGGAVPQPDLSETVPMSPDDIARSLRSLEEKRLIQRQWNTEKKAYLVFAR